MQCHGKLSHHLRKTPFEAAAINYVINKREKQSGAKEGALWDLKMWDELHHDELAAVVEKSREPTQSFSRNTLNH